MTLSCAKVEIILKLRYTSYKIDYSEQYFASTDINYEALRPRLYSASFSVYYDIVDPTVRSTKKLYIFIKK